MPFTTHDSQPRTATLVLNAALALMLLIVVAAALILRPSPARPNFEFIPQMAHAPRFNAFAANPNFSNGATLQIAEPHTIARGFMPLHYAATPQDALRAGEELHNPFAANNQRARQRGERVFTIYCSPCHGAAATGNGVVAQRGFPPPPSLLAPHAVAMKDGQMFHVLTFGQNNMPNYASQISRDDRWNAIAYVRSLQVPTAPTGVSVPRPPATSPALQPRPAALSQTLLSLPSRTSGGTR